MFTDSADYYFDPATSEAATIAGAAETVYGHYDRDYVEIETGSVRISGYKPVFICSTAAVSAVVRGAAMSIEGVSETFTVAHKETIDRVETRLVLEET